MAKLSEQELSEQKLSAQDVLIHQRRIQDSLKKTKPSFIPILDSFRLENGGILPQLFYKTDRDAKASGYVAFVPAAGAASRYFQPLQSLRLALADDDPVAILHERTRLKSEGAETWPLPEALAQFVASRGESLPQALSLKAALDEISWPKALLPYRQNGKSFLQKKSDEHAAMQCLLGEVFVAPLGSSQIFAQHLGPRATQSLFMEQGPELSTIRFTRDGEAFRDEHKQLSLVPAGHGMLVRLFPEILAKWPKAHSLFIRNIDNVIEEEASCLSASESFLVQHQQILEGLRAIRKSLHDGQLETAALRADEIRARFQTPGRPAGESLTQLPHAERKLWALLLEIFHCPKALAETMRSRLGDAKALEALYARPLNSLGQVPNNGQDVGGSPVLATHENGEVSICLELPHASPEDRKTFLENPEVATHFNPVFVAAEIPEDNSVYDLEQYPFWILAEKTLHGTPVVYHEIVLYEVLGNSYTANVIFPEIPRRLFHPHKSLLDGIKKR